jgi:hypothetical protein
MENAVAHEHVVGMNLQGGIYKEDSYGSEEVIHAQGTRDFTNET